MNALKEIRAVRQNPGERKRRWFTSAQMNLYVWQSRAGTPVKFQLCYDQERKEKALTWSRQGGCVHEGVDAGDSAAGKAKQAAILVADGAVNADDLAADFSRAAKGLPAEITGYVLEKLERHSARARGG